MPKQPNARKTARVAPYPLSTTSDMASQVAYYPMSAHTPISSHTPTDWSSNYPYSTQHPLMQLPDVMNQMPPTPHNLTRPSASPQPAQNGPWTTEEDEILCDYRTRGFGWSQIQEKHFPGKSANACRKRHERLMTKRRSTDWDETRLESLAVNYRQMRPQIWGPLAERLGEKWEHVEKACMQQGLKGLQNRAANHRRNHSSISSSSKLGNFSTSDNENWYHPEQEHDSHDDSGISLQVNRADRLRNGRGSSVPQWQETVLRPQLDHLPSYQLSPSSVLTPALPRRV